MFGKNILKFSTNIPVSASLDPSILWCFSIIFPDKTQPLSKTKETLITALALFSLFFGAGNLILPPLLGFNSSRLWWLAALGFCFSAVLIPILGLLAHAKLQGTLFDFGKKVSSTFSIIYSVLVYIVSISLPSPRTAAVTHEMAIAPFFDISALVTSIGYFSLVFVFVLNRSKILDVIGKWLTPTIVLTLLAIIFITIGSFDYHFGEAHYAHPFSTSIIEGYQTFDAIGAVVVGGVIIVSINLRNKNAQYREKRTLIRHAAYMAGFALALIYTGLILTGGLTNHLFDHNISRTALVKGISVTALGNIGQLSLSVLVSLACLTTAVGIVTGAADFIKDRYRGSQRAYFITALAGCLIGVVMGQFQVDHIIAFALPVLLLIYPITIVLILLNVLPNRYTSTIVFRAVVVTTILFSIPDFLGGFGPSDFIAALRSYIPLNNFGLEWAVPAGLVFVVTNITSKVKS